MFVIQQPSQAANHLVAVEAKSNKTNALMAGKHKSIYI